MQRDSLGYGDGIKSIAEALRVLAQAPQLLRWLLPPFLLTLLFDLTAFVVLQKYLHAWLENMVPNEGFFVWIGTLLKVLSSFLVLLALGVCFSFMFITLSSPFQEFLSEEVETILQEKPPTDVPEGVGSMLRSLWYSLYENSLLLLLELPALFLSWIPFVGQIFLFFWTTILLGYAFFSVPAGRRVLSFGEKRAIVQKHWKAVFMLGLFALIASFVPFLNLAMLPVLVIAGTILYLRGEVLHKPS